MWRSIGVFNFSFAYLVATFGWLHGTSSQISEQPNSHVWLAHSRKYQMSHTGLPTIEISAKPSENAKSLLKVVNGAQRFIGIAMLGLFGFERLENQSALAQKFQLVQEFQARLVAGTRC